MTDAESAPVACATTRTSFLTPQTLSCSTAAARKVSPAARTTSMPLFLKAEAILPMVVVFPAPFTPTMRMTKGFLSWTMSGLLTGRRISRSSDFTSSVRASASRRSLSFALSFTLSRIFSAVL